MLTWEDSYAIALELRASFPNIDMDEVSLGMIYRWTVELPGFKDDPNLASESILTDILKEWVELTGNDSLLNGINPTTTDTSQQSSRR